MTESAQTGSSEQRESIGVNTAQNRAQQPPSETGPNPASETNRGQSDNREYSTEVIYSCSNQDSDSWDAEEMASERSKRKVGHQQHVEPEYFYI